MITDDPRRPPAPAPARLADDEAAALSAIASVGGEIHTERVRGHLAALQDLRDRGLVSYTRGNAVRITDAGRAALAAHT